MVKNKKILKQNQINHKKIKVNLKIIININLKKLKKYSLILIIMDPHLRFNGKEIKNKNNNKI